MMKKNKLDSVLKAWGERNQPDPARLAGLEARVRDSWPSKTAWPSAADELAPARRFALRWVAAAAGLMLLALAAGSLLRSFRHSEIQYAEGNGSLELARFTDEQVSARHAILDEVEALFAGQVRWIRLDADGMRLGMAEDSAGPATKDARLAVRTVMVVREESRGDWKPVWSSDVLTRAEEYIELSPEAGFAGAMDLWVHRLPDGRYALDSEIEWPSPQLARSYETRIMSPGKPEQILSQKTAGREYRIYQSIEPLCNGNG